MSDLKPMHIVYSIGKYQATELTNQKKNRITSYINMSKEGVNGFAKIKCIWIKMNENKYLLHNSLM